MNNKILIVKEATFREYSNLVGDYDMSFINPFQYIALDLFVSQITGESLLTRLEDGTVADDLSADETKLVEDYIQPVIIHYTMSEAFNNLLFKVENSGIVKRNSENGTAAELTETSFLADSEKRLAQSYGTRLRDYLNANKDLFPEYKQEIDGEIEPNITATVSGGMWLGKGFCNNELN